MSSHQAVVEVAKEIESKYFHDTIYCKSYANIIKQLEMVWSNFKEGKKMARKGRTNLTKAKAYIELIKKKDQLFDVYSEDIERRKTLEVEWGVKMGERERLYLEDQRGPRLMSCDHGVDPTFYRAFMKQQRERERMSEYREKREEEFRGRTIEQITDLLRSQGEILSATPSSVDTPFKVPGCSSDTPVVTLEEGEEGEEMTRKKRRLFQSEEEISSDPLPLEYRHLRHSERKVKDNFYTTCTTLSGEGMSLQECITSIITIGNGMFGRRWKKSDGDNDSFDIDTAPTKMAVLEKLRLIEAESLSLVVEEMTRGGEQGHMVTHASDSTTKKRVGQFIGQVSA